MKAVIDADQIPYACGFSCKDEPLNHACQMAKKAMQKIMEDTEADEYEVYIAGQGNYREDIAVTQPYKGNRSAPRPDHWEGVRNYLRESWGAIEVDDMEVDDKVSMILWEDFLEGGGSIVLSSGDKDLNNTPGMHYNPRTRKKYWVTSTQAARHFWYQMLAGDKVDHILGLPRGSESLIEKYDTLTHHAKTGFGEGSAKKLMACSTDTGEDVALDAYVHWGKDEEIAYDDLVDYINEQGQLLWMLRELDELGEPVMWTVNEDKLKDIWSSYDHRV